MISAYYHCNSKKGRYINEKDTKELLSSSKLLMKHICYDCTWRLNGKSTVQNKNGIMISVNVNVNNYGNQQWRFCMER